MPFPVKIQPVGEIDLQATIYKSVKTEAKSRRLKKLLDWQFSGVLRTSTAAEKVTAGGAPAVEELPCSKDGLNELEPSSVCLEHMVQNFIEEINEKQLPSGRSGRCHCFNGKYDDSSDDEPVTIRRFGDSKISSSGDAYDIVKNLVGCASVSERALLVDMAKIVEKNKLCKRKDDNCRKIAIANLISLGYDASICKSRWERNPLYPAGEYEYIDAIVEGERLIIDVDFRSEFEVARSTKAYRTILQKLPYIFVGKPDRLQRIISVVAEAAEQSMKKKGMDLPPWRRAEYVKAKWFSPYTRTLPSLPIEAPVRPCLGVSKSDPIAEKKQSLIQSSQWVPPEIKPKSSVIGVKVVTGLASLIEVKP